MKELTNRTEIFKDEFQGEGDINPMVVHPTAETLPSKRHLGAAPYLFFVLDLPRNFRDYLVRRAIFEVDSDLKTLFVENGRPVPHDYIMTLKNYNMSVDTEELKQQAKDRVKESVLDRMFKHNTPASNKARSFLMANRDNLPSSYSDEQVFNYIRDSIRVELLIIKLPVTKVDMPVYNLYIFPPTKTPIRLDNWRRWFDKQKYYAGVYGVGEKYEYKFKCFHCKSIDHPAGMCPYAMGSGNGTTPGDSDDDDLLPIKDMPNPGPKGKSQPGSSKAAWNVVRKGKGRETAPPPQANQPGPSKAKGKKEPARASKKRKVMV